MATLHNRLDALARRADAMPCSDPHHPPPAVVLRAGEPEPPACPSCGGVCQFVVVTRRVEIGGADE